MHPLPLHLEAGSDVRQSLEALARERGSTGYVLSVVGNLSTAVFQCPGRSAPTRLRGELEIITLSGTLTPQGVHLHLSFSDGDCRVWGGHLEPGTLVLRGADLLVGFLPAAPAAPSGADGTPLSLAEANEPPSGTAGPDRLRPAGSSQAREPRVEIAVLPGCPWSARALRLLRTLSIPHRLTTVDSQVLRSELQQRSGSSSLPQVFIDGQAIGGYDALVERHASQALEALRDG